jgi:DNA-binding MarR family transcriptional regulator
MPADQEETVATCRTLVGDDGIRSWSDTHADAWIGMLEAHKRLTRELESELEAEYGLSLSGVELLGRLAAAEGRMLRLTELAGRAGLSVSRVSRITDMLEARELVERRPCPADARAKNAFLTDTGLELLRAAQATHFAGVEERFFDRLEPGEVEALALIFSRFAPGAASDCT